MHQRRVIREAIADYLNDNVEALRSRVFKSREAPANVMSILDEGPMANVYSRKDHIKPEDMPPSGFDSAVKRTLELAIEITAVGAWTVDDKLDDLADAIEVLLEHFNADPERPDIPGLPSAELRLTSTDIDSSDAFEQPLGGALMLYEITYWRPYRTDTSPKNKICEVFANGPDGVVAQVGECEGVCTPGPVA